MPSKFGLRFILLLLVLLLFDWENSLAENVVDLPDPDQSSDVLLDDILGFETRLRNVDNNSLLETSKTISQLLFSAQGISHFPGRTVPSAGGTYPMDIFVLSNPNYSVQFNSVHRYNPFDHTLEVSNPKSNYSQLVQLIANSTTNQKIINSQFIFIITAEFERTTGKYGDRGIQYVYLELGHLIQNLRIQSRALNYNIIELYEFEEKSLQEIIKNDFIPLSIVLFEPQSITEENSSSAIPKLGLSSSDISVEEAIYNRKSVRDYISNQLPISKLSELIEFSYYRRDPFTQNYIFPSILKNYPVSLILSVTNVIGISNGLYSFNYLTRGFDLLSNQSRREEIYQQSLNQEWVLNAQVVLIWQLNLSKLLNKDYSTDYQKRIGLFEIGMIAQNIYLKSYTLQLGTVVVGAFSESNIRSIIGSPPEMLPIYVMPVGMVSSAIAGNFSSFSLQWFESIFAWISILFFYLSCLIMTPPLKRGLRKGTKWFHLTLGIFAILAGFIHVILYHGGWYLLISPTSKRINRLIESVLFSFPSGDDQNLYDFGLNIARISTWIFLVFIAIATISFIKQSNTRIKTIFIPLHKYLGYIFLGFIFFHIYANSYWLSLFGWLSYFILVITTLLYIIFHNWMRIKVILNSI